MSPFETLPEEAVLCIAAHLNNWHTAHAAFLCTTRAARFSNDALGCGARMAFLRYFTMYASALDLYRGGGLYNILYDVMLYYMPGRNQRYAVPVDNIVVTHNIWDVTFSRLRALYQRQCQRSIARGVNTIPVFMPSAYFDCLKTVRRFKHMYENEAITAFQTCFALQKFISHCNYNARGMLHYNTGSQSCGEPNLCAADTTLATWITNDTNLARDIKEFSGSAFLLNETVLALPRTLAALNILLVPVIEPYGDRVAALQGRRPGCATCRQTGRPCH